MSVLRHVRQDLAEFWRRFWRQPNKKYRNFQIAFFLLGVHFLIPSFTYGFLPQNAIASFTGLGQALGEAPYKFADGETGYIWRILAAGNVFTLAFMCFLIQANVKRFYAVLVPLCVLKTSASLGFLVTYLYAYAYLPFLGVFIWDGTNVLMFLYFAHTAFWSLEEWGEETAVPGLCFKASD